MHFIRLKSGTQEDALFAATGFLFLSKESGGKNFYWARMNVRAAMSGWDAEESVEKDPTLADPAGCPHQGEKENCGKDPR